MQLQMKSLGLSDEFINGMKKMAANTLMFSALMASTAPSFAADYAPASAPPLVPQIAKSNAPKAAQSGPPTKWIYSKFLDEVGKNGIEKVTFSPDGKKALAIDDDGDRYTIDIPNDPNLLSFLVQHKVEINVAPINANGGLCEYMFVSIFFLLLFFSFAFLHMKND